MTKKYANHNHFGKYENGTSHGITGDTVNNTNARHRLTGKESSLPNTTVARRFNGCGVSKHESGIR